MDFSQFCDVILTPKILLLQTELKERGWVSHWKPTSTSTVPIRSIALTVMRPDDELIKFEFGFTPRTDGTVMVRSRENTVLKDGGAYLVDIVPSCQLGELNVASAEMQINNFAATIEARYPVLLKSSRKKWQNSLRKNVAARGIF